MGADPLDSLRLALMQDVLPVGMAVVERARRGGARDVADVFSEEGEDAARQVRERLDRIQPGLGNPVMKVDVKDVPVSVRLGDDPVATVSADRLELQASLARISERLLLLEQRLTPVS
jgi:hypothetical protein